MNRLPAATAIAAAVMFTLAACGGGGSGDKPTAMTQQPTAEPALPTLATGLTIGDVAPLRPTAPDVFRAEMLADPANTFRAYSASIIRDWDNDRVKVTGRYSVQSVASDGNYGFHITYGDTEADAPTKVHFPREAYRSSGNNLALEDLGYWLWAISSVPFNGSNYGSTETSTLAFLGSSLHSRHGDGSGGPYHFIVYGLETPVADLPTGTAIYSGGGVSIQQWDNNLGDISTSAGRTLFQGDSRLMFDFADGSLTGRIDNMRRRLPGEATYTNLSATTGFDITAGGTENGQFAATITGTDTNPNAPLADSMRGFEGGLVGAFYGSDAGSVGGVLNASRKMGGDDRVMGGYIWGSKQ